MNLHNLFIDQQLLLTGKTYHQISYPFRICCQKVNITPVEFSMLLKKNSRRHE